MVLKNTQAISIWESFKTTLKTLKGRWWGILTMDRKEGGAPQQQYYLLHPWHFCTIMWSWKAAWLIQRNDITVSSALLNHEATLRGRELVPALTTCHMSPFPSSTIAYSFAMETRLVWSCCLSYSLHLAYHWQACRSVSIRADRSIESSEITGSSGALCR